jgi:hypothetical protein
LNLNIFVSTNAFDNSTFFYEQLKFTWLVWVVIAVEFGGEIDAPSWDPIPLYDTFNLITQPAFPPKLAITVSGLAISHSFSMREVERRHLDRGPVIIKPMHGYPHHAYGRGIQYVEHAEGHGDKLFAAACNLGVEGIFFEEARRALSVWPLENLDQSQKSKFAGCHKSN